MDLADEVRDQMLDEDRIDDYLAELPRTPSVDGMAGHFHACTHTTFSPNVGHGPGKTNTIPDRVTLDIDIRTMPGDSTGEVAAHLREALGDLSDEVETEVVMDASASASRIDTPLWDSLERAITKPFPTARLNPQFIVGFTDSRIYREKGSVSYGAGLMSPSVDAGEFSRRFHGHDERIDIESLRLTTGMYFDVCEDFLG